MSEKVAIFQIHRGGEKVGEVKKVNKSIDCYGDIFPYYLALYPMRQTVASRIKCGVECEFVQLTKKKGVKLFSTEDEAQRALERQQLAYLNRLAPRAFSDEIEKFGIKKGKAILIKWGYITQVVRTFNSDAQYDKYMHLEDDLYERLSCICLQRDIHWGNLGLIGKRLVKIDFGDASS